MKWSIQTPNIGGIDAATNWPASFVGGARPRKSSTAPTTVATAAPRRTPRLSPERSRKASDGTRIPRKIASPPRRGIGRRFRRRVGAVHGTEKPGHAADRRRQQHDDDERDRGAVQDLRCRPQLVEHQCFTWATSSRTAGRLRRRDPGGCSLVVEATVDRGNDDGDVRVFAVHAGDALGRSDQRDEANSTSRPRASRSRPRPRSSYRLRAWGRAG